MTISGRIGLRHVASPSGQGLQHPEHAQDAIGPSLATCRSGTFRCAGSRADGDLRPSLACSTGAGSRPRPRPGRHCGKGPCPAATHRRSRSRHRPGTTRTRRDRPRRPCSRRTPVRGCRRAPSPRHDTRRCIPSSQSAVECPPLCRRPAIWSRPAPAAGRSGGGNRRRVSRWHAPRARSVRTSGSGLPGGAATAGRPAQPTVSRPRTEKAAVAVVPVTGWRAGGPSGSPAAPAREAFRTGRPLLRRRSGKRPCRELEESFAREESQA